MSMPSIAAVTVEGFLFDGPPWRRRVCISQHTTLTKAVINAKNSIVDLYRSAAFADSSKSSTELVDAPASPPRDKGVVTVGAGVVAPEATGVVLRELRRMSGFNVVVRPPAKPLSRRRSVSDSTSVSVSMASE